MGIILKFVWIFKREDIFTYICFKKIRTIDGGIRMRREEERKRAPSWREVTSGCGVVVVPERVRDTAGVGAVAGGGAPAAVIGFGFRLQPDREHPQCASLRLLRALPRPDVADAGRVSLSRDASAVRRLAAFPLPLQRLQEVPRLQKQTWQQN